MFSISWRKYLLLIFQGQDAAIGKIWIPQAVALWVQLTPSWTRDSGIYNLGIKICVRIKLWPLMRSLKNWKADLWRRKGSRWSKLDLPVNICIRAIFTTRLRVWNLNLVFNYKLNFQVLDWNKLAMEAHLHLKRLPHWPRLQASSSPMWPKLFSTIFSHVSQCTTNTVK